MGNGVQPASMCELNLERSTSRGVRDLLRTKNIGVKKVGAELQGNTSGEELPLLVAVNL